MTLFPFFENIDNKTFLVIGGGKIAKGKIKRLSAFTKNIVVLAEQTDITNFKVIKKRFEDADIFLGDYVIGATDSHEINTKIASLCKANKIPVNVVDDPENCTFIFPSLIKRGNLTIGITSAGKSPALSRHVRQKIEAVLPDNIDQVLERAGQVRDWLKDNEPVQKVRSKANKKILAALLEDGEVSDSDIEKILEKCRGDADE
ncbi:MAG: bifunctional precorrin-2 dehydrogenase/sirohydrochlorin ferrochelatase [Ruminococcus sp.]|nr:bifunctional precorrin-2 dehydrogenase/sirohydrochlorin ferrochelatase [Ruminococcus sp.]